MDIDFDVMITDIAPMDLLLQRIGRLQRHEIERLDCYKNPKLYVLGISEDFKFDLGSSVVYGDYLLTKTQYYLPPVPQAGRRGRGLSALPAPPTARYPAPAATRARSDATTTGCEPGRRRRPEHR